ncbi:fumarylacetoacetate hydrolase family protein [Dyella caseinilytica]|uniref:Fumarylacetoacetate hydrolase family protein n=1 Tax=Dyella caseinilytica TaxID=1849581 RepID=A0ABX7GYF6_9GAMM|nr:fumarylacetoacetate hydrolase family protein [Dyella caseinilytica]QRN55540.1 fumarylacetoacetate hydrolase family protein [Dyella caseinilytica]GGA02532.1 ureidoglycolate lyase [Dyella caseinilytica]
MKLVRFGAPGSERPGLIDAEGKLRDLSYHVPDITGHHLSDEALARIASIDVKTLSLIEEEVRFGPPISSVGKMICVGLNYTDHAKEAGLAIPTEPLLFLKGCSPTGPNDAIAMPPNATHCDWEVELAIVIGKHGLHIDQAHALEHVAGYCVLNDFTEREFQLNRAGQWTKGKSFPGFSPLGPWLVTRDEVREPGKLRLWLDVNGTRRQDGSTQNLIFDVPFMVAYLSQFMALNPGDIIATGTPAGVGAGHKPDPIFLTDGDCISLGIEGLGTQTQHIVAWEKRPKPWL